ncbi:hypothetical protein D3C72_2109780 [compost metagenome]
MVAKRVCVGAKAWSSMWHTEVLPALPVMPMTLPCSRSRAAMPSSTSAWIGSSTSSTGKSGARPGTGLRSTAPASVGCMRATDSDQSQLRSPSLSPKRSWVARVQ